MSRSGEASLCDSWFLCPASQLLEWGQEWGTFWVAGRAASLRDQTQHKGPLTVCAACEKCQSFCESLF